MTNITTDETTFLDDLSAEEAIRAEAHAQEHARQADEAYVLNLLGIDPLPNHRRDPEPAQVRDRWED